MVFCSALCWFSVTPFITHKPVGPFWCCFPSGWLCVCPRTLWVSPTNSPVRLRVSPAAASTPTGVFNQWFEALFPTLELLVARSVTRSTSCCLTSQLQLCPPRSTICCLHRPPPCPESSPPRRPSPPLLPVWMNVSSLSPLLSDIHTVQFSVSSGCFCF